MQKKALGRGLESLIPALAANKASTDEIIIIIPLDKIKSNRFQPRNKFDEVKLQELARSIEKHGLAQPILVAASIVPGEYEIIAGERRYRASKLAGNKDIKAIVKQSADDKQRFDLALVENIQRENLDPIEEARAFKRLIEEFGHTHEQISDIVGKERSVISNALRLLSLPEDVQLLITEDKISPGHGKILAGIEDKNRIRAIVDRILNENLSVRAVEKIISELKPEKESDGQKKQEIELINLKEEIQRKLGTKVNISGTGKKGRIEIYYYSLEDLERITKELKFSC
ncbi:chromosome partitioning protein ParB [Endomicrobiia bacterium]|uniref:ParB-like chromosome partitioning protein n=1 Tax=Endomicrobium trichonymphae TaxID=1408204 RepID=B1GZ54_ENDTX|nr:ParB/RepB/Spo0J family partition protein [Candidatus Endomicrobium trichonymphae]GHT04359.1 chromosome partitioning protein ParB [Endomicrobiia bacterium]BAG13536.1 ParB-like chromosome partitioning protein [Candidatus Endomicrobium trichonymphae]BAV58625.1 chromosome partitioning protein [Candidatus Endomicrobium trichonymphae]GHT13135.1 chromosome partitioning protein ParB [Endomicrobiia bacterium]GHT20361.1 chromosome partitioning protein ParB [Endomicrobiia bacterium]